MGELSKRAALGLALTLTMAGCASSNAPPAPTSESPPERVPNRQSAPLPEVPAGDIDRPPGDGGVSLEIVCGGRKPYLCSAPDGGFECSELPCMPDCRRVGCILGEVCALCEGGYRCQAPGQGC